MFQCFKKVFELHLRQNTTLKKNVFGVKIHMRYSPTLSSFCVEHKEKNLIEIRWSERNDSCNALDIRSLHIATKISFGRTQCNNLSTKRVKGFRLACSAQNIHEP